MKSAEADLVEAAATHFLFAIKTRFNHCCKHS